MNFHVVNLLKGNLKKQVKHTVTVVVTDMVIRYSAAWLGPVEASLWPSSAEVTGKLKQNWSFWIKLRFFLFSSAEADVTMTHAASKYFYCSGEMQHISQEDICLSLRQQCSVGKPCSSSSSQTFPNHHLTKSVFFLCTVQLLQIIPIWECRGDGWGGGGVMWSRLIVLCLRNELSVGNWDVERLRELHSWTSGSGNHCWWKRHKPKPLNSPKYLEILLKIPVILGVLCLVSDPKLSLTCLGSLETLGPPLNHLFGSGVFRFNLLLL